MRLEGFLKKVNEVKIKEIADSQSKISLETVRYDAEQSPAPVSFLKPMQESSAENIGIIAEVKKASPSKGDICPDLEPELCAEQYTQGGAKAISVLTESQYFKGSFDDLIAVCNNTDLPVLRKDFTISSYQIYEAKKAGASSILLITTMLSPEQLKDYIQLVRDLDMEPLVEITSEKEFEIAYDAGAIVMDINNRNLQTLEVDLNVSKRIGAIIPDGVIPVEASGISSFSDIQKGLETKIYNFLVGESIVKAENTINFIKSLRNAD